MAGSLMLEKPVKVSFLGPCWNLPVILLPGENLAHLLNVAIKRD